MQVSVYMTAKDAWGKRAPDCAKRHWNVIRSQPNVWCQTCKFPRYVDETAHVYAKCI
jgi:hypothetical protein